MTQPLDHSQPNTNSPLYFVLATALQSGVGALAASLFTPIVPLGGAVFGASSFLSGRLIDWTAEKFSCCPDQALFKTARCVATFFGGIAAGALIATAAGFPITFAAGAVLTLAMMITHFALGLIMGSCMCSSAITTVLLLNSEDTSAVRVRV